MLRGGIFIACSKAAIDSSFDRGGTLGLRYLLLLARQHLLMLSKMIAVSYMVIQGYCSLFGFPSRGYPSSSIRNLIINIESRNGAPLCNLVR